MGEITAQLVKELREKTGAGMMDCKKALAEAGGDMERAVQELRKKGLKGVEKRAGKVAAEGLVYSYIHPGNRIGVLLELNCETDFVARGEQFLSVAKDIAMHIAWAKPRYLNREEVSADALAREQEVFMAQLKPEQEKVADKIISGKVEKFYQEVCLLEQFDIKDAGAKKRVRDLLTELSVTVGEKIEIRRFQRFEIGEGIEKPKADYAAEVAAVAQL